MSNFTPATLQCLKCNKTSQESVDSDYIFLGEMIHRCNKCKQDTKHEVSAIKHKVK